MGFEDFSQTKQNKKSGFAAFSTLEKSQEFERMLAEKKKQRELEANKPIEQPLQKSFVSKAADIFLNRPREAVLAPVIQQFQLPKEDRLKGGLLGKGSAKEIIAALKGERKEATGSNLLGAMGWEGKGLGKELTGGLIDIVSTPAFGPIIKGGQAIAKGLGITKPIAGRIAGSAAGGGIYGGLEATAEGEPLPGIAKRAALDAALFAGGDAALMGAGKAISKGFAKFKKPAKTIEPEVLPPLKELPGGPYKALTEGVNWRTPTPLQTHMALERVKPKALSAGQEIKALPEGYYPNWEKGTGFPKKDHWFVDPQGRINDVPFEVLALPEGTGKTLVRVRNMTKDELPVPRTDIGDPAYLGKLSEDYNKLISEEVKRLKGEIGGVIKYRPNDDGPLFRVSQNPEWYREFWTEFNRAPNSGEYRNIAIANLLKGNKYTGEPASEEFNKIVSELSRGQKLPEEWHALQSSIRQISNDPVYSSGTESQIKEMQSLLREMKTEQKKVEPYGLEKNISRLDEIEDTYRRKMINKSYYGKYADSIGIIPENKLGDWLFEKAMKAKKGDAEYVSKAKDLVLEANRTHMAKVTTAGIRTDKWKKQLSEEQLCDLGAFVEKTDNIKSRKSFQAINKEVNDNPQMKKIYKEYMKTQEGLRKEINEYLKTTTEGDYINFIKNYLPHFYIRKSGVTAEESLKRLARWRESSPNAQKRMLPTLKEAEQMGLEPLTQNIAELQRKWADINWRVATNKKMLTEIRDIVNSDGLKVIMKSKDAPADWKRIKHPAFAEIYARKTPDGKTILFEGEVAVDPEIYPVIRQLIEEPLEGNIISKIELFNAFAKKSQLSLSLFHHWALTESAIGALGRKGLFLVGEETKGLGWITQPHRVGKKLMADEKFLEDAIMHGLTLDPVADAHVGLVKRRLQRLEKSAEGKPGLEYVAAKLREFNDKWDQSLWGNYHSGLKAYSYYDLVEQGLKKLPANATEKEIKVMKEKVAEIVNDMFGGQEWVSKWWLSPRGKQIAQMLMLAPDWTLSNLSIAGKAITRAKDPIQGPITRRYWANMALSQMMIIAGLNYAFSGKWPWENEKGHKTEIDVSDAIHALNNALGIKEDNQKQRYYMHPGKQVREVLGWLQNPNKTLGAKASPAVHTVIEQMTGSTTSGWDMPWKTEEKGFWESVPERIKTIGQKFVPFSVSGIASQTQFAFTFPMRKGMTPWKAYRAYEDLIKAQVDPKFYQVKMTDETAIKLKKELDNACVLNGLDPQKMYRQARSSIMGIYYNSMWESLNKGNMSEADKAAKILLRMGVTPKTLQTSAQNRDKTLEDYKKAMSLFYNKQI